MSAPLDAIKIDAEGPRPVPMGDVNIESAVTNPLTLSDEPISSIDLHVEILEDFDYDASDSEDDESDDSEDGSNDELKIFIVRIIRMTKYNLSETRAENQQVDIQSSLLSMQSTDTHSPITTVRRGRVFFNTYGSTKRC